MTTLIEVINAAKQLPLDEQRELFREMGYVLRKSEAFSSDPTSIPGLPPNFTQRLQQLFHSAKRKALAAKAE